MTKKFNIKTSVTASVILIFGLLLYLKFLQASAVNDIDNEMKNEVSQKIQSWIAFYKNNDSILRSSSPYTYINNDKFEEIKNLSPEYLPYILREIENEPSAIFALWGLNEITRVKHLPRWDSDDQCVSIWNNYIETLPSKFNELKEDLYSTTDEQKIKLKTQEIVDLGYPVLPLILKEDNIKIKEIEKALFMQSITEVSYEKANKEELENIKTNEEEKINEKINAYKYLMKYNKIKGLEAFKIVRNYK